MAREEIDLAENEDILGLLLEVQAISKERETELDTLRCASNFLTSGMYTSLLGKELIVVTDRLFVTDAESPRALEEEGTLFLGSLASYGHIGGPIGSIVLQFEGVQALGLEEEDSKVLNGRNITVPVVDISSISASQLQ